MPTSPPARQHAVNLRQTTIVVGQIAKSESRRDQLKLAGSKRKIQRIGFDPANVSACRTSLPPAPAWHARSPRRTAWWSAVQPAIQRECHVAGAAAQIEHLRVGTPQHFGEHARGAVPPHPIDVHREHVIQQIVARRDRGEHLAHRIRCGRFVARARRSGAHNALSVAGRRFVALSHRQQLRISV